MNRTTSAPTSNHASEGKTMRLILSALLLSLLIACAAPRPPLNTASGRPEVTIRNVTRKDVSDRIVGALASKGFAIRSANEFAIIGAKRADDDFTLKLLYGSRYDRVPEQRITFTLIEASGTVRVFSTLQIVTNPGSAFERVDDLAESTKHDQQAMLMQLRDGFRGSN